MIETVIVARGAEERAVRAAVRRVGVGVRILTTGIGPRSAARAADDALAAGRFGTTLIAGLCGALDPGLVVGDALAYATIARPGERAVHIERAFAERIVAAVPGALGGIRALASDTVVTAARDKRELASRYDVDAVDMETHALLDRLGRAGVAAASLRVVSDGADDELPALDRSLDGCGGIDAGALALAMVRSPRRAARFAVNAIAALRALERAVGAVLAS